MVFEDNQVMPLIPPVELPGRGRNLGGAETRVQSHFSDIFLER
jgi:hypothetical protein